MNLRDMVALVERDAADVPHLTPEWAPAMKHDDNYLDSAWLWGINGTGTGIYSWAHSTDAENLARVADTYQDALQEELWELGADTAWPRCRFCPGTHPLRVTEHNGVVWWTCPRDVTQGIRLGHLMQGQQQPTGAPVEPPYTPPPISPSEHRVADDLVSWRTTESTISSTMHIHTEATDTFRTGVTITFDATPDE